MDAVIVVAVIGFLVILYILPSLYAAFRQTTMMALILVLDLLLGWTVIGWFAALALAVLLPSAKLRATPASQPGSRAIGEASGTNAASPAVTGSAADFLIDPMRVAAASLLGPVFYQYWWLWRFFQFAKREHFPRSRSFWWILVPFYGYVVIGRLFVDLESKLGPSRPASFTPQSALAFLVAANVSGGIGVRFGTLPFVIGGLALSCVFTAIAFYQAQAAVNAYVRVSNPGAVEAGLFRGEAIGVVVSLAMLGLLALGGNRPATGPSVPSGLVGSLPSVSATAFPSPSTGPTAIPSPPAVPQQGDVLSMTSETGDYIGQGQSRVLAPPTFRFFAAEQNGPSSITITVESNASGNALNFVRWTVELAAPRDTALKVGAYLDAQRAAFRTGAAPGIDVFGDGRGCNQVFGSFTITRLTVDAQGTVQQFEASFEQHCESATAPALHGYVRFGVPSDTQTAGVIPAVA